MIELLSDGLPALSLLSVLLYGSLKGTNPLMQLLIRTENNSIAHQTPKNNQKREGFRRWVYNTYTSVIFQMSNVKSCECAKCLHAVYVIPQVLRKLHYT